MPLRLSILLICFLLPPAAHSQHYQAYAHRYGMADGLPHREVGAVLQDRHGFIWTATSGGVARFDGRKFRVFNHMEDGLHEDVVDLLAEDANGHIWVSHSSGNHWVDIIDPITGKMLTFFPNPAPEGLTSLYFPEAPKAEGLLEVFDWLGNKVHRQTIRLEGGSDVLAPLDLRSFPSGMYVATLEIGDNLFSEKLILKQ